MSATSLPTPRQLLTSVLNAISSLPAPERQAQAQTATATARANSLQGGDETQPPAPTNPLKLIDPSHRPLFTTLHVLFPSLLLPALDLLDRGLVTRLCLRAEGGLGERQGVDDVPMRDSEGESEGDGVGATRQTAPPPPPPVYLVRSAQKSTRRPYGGSSGGGGGGGGDPTAPMSSTQKAYLAQTTAWNCTCAAFAFSAFAPAGGGSSLLPTPGRRTASRDAKDDDAQRKGKGKGRGRGKVEEEGGAEDVRVDDALPPAPRAMGEGDEEREQSGTEAWQFGGLSLDGSYGDGDGEAVPPCCKHLLACVLAERWEATLGRYTDRRMVGREEMAGIFADI